MKATRVHDVEIGVFDCPVCRESVSGTVTVEVFLGEPSVRWSIEEDPVAVVPATTRLRSLVVEHRCDPERVRALAAEETEEDKP